MRDFAIELNPGSGELARVASILARHQVTLRAGTAMIVGRRLVARFIPTDVAATRAALDAAGVGFEEAEIVPVLLESRAGELAMLSTRLANGGVGVRAIYLTATVGHLIEVAVVPTNLARARRALE